MNREIRSHTNITKTRPWNICRGLFYIQGFIFYQNVEFWYTLELPRRGGSKEYRQSMFWSKNTKNVYINVNSIFTIYN